MVAIRVCHLFPVPARRVGDNPRKKRGPASSSKFAVAFPFCDCLVGCLFAVLPTGTSPASRLGERNFGETRTRVPLALSPALGECFAGARLSAPPGRQPGSGAGRWEGRDETESGSGTLPGWGRGTEVGRWAEERRVQPLLRALSERPK